MKLLAHHSSFLKTIQRRLLDWFTRNCRDLPWRRTRDPYRIWISEIMLQQTQVATAIPYYERFLKAFPTVAKLATADEQEVLRLWEGLGYYRRARHLHQAARELVRNSPSPPAPLPRSTGGEGGRNRPPIKSPNDLDVLPNDPEVWKTLPGIGRYTLGAILSQAFDRRLPILEANSTRVLSRLFAVRGATKESKVQRRLWELAEAILPTKRVGDFNQALMELGALVCTVESPKCELCPLAKICESRRLGLENRIPKRASAKKIIAAHDVAIVVRRGGKVLVVQRSDEGRWANMWEFPHGLLRDDESLAAAAERTLTELTGLRAKIGCEIKTLKHAVTHHAITLTCFEATYRRGSFQSHFYQRGRWLQPSQLAQLPLGSAQRRLAQFVVDKFAAGQF